MLGPPPEVEGPRERRLPAQYREEPDLPVGPPIAEVEEDLQDAEMAEIAFTFAATAHSNPSEPQTFREAMQSPEAKFWTQAIQKEIQSLEDMGTFKTVDTLPTDRALQSTPRREGLLANAWNRLRRDVCTCRKAHFNSHHVCSCSSSQTPFSPSRCQHCLPK